MNSNELITNMIKHQPFERIALYEGFWDETLVAWMDQGYPSDITLVNGKERAVPVDPFHHFNYDLHRCGGFFDTEPLFGQEVIIEETDEWEIRLNGAGASLKWWKHKSGTPEHIDFKMDSRAVWEKEYRHHLMQPDRRRFNGKWWGDGSLSDDRHELALARSRNQWAWVGHVFLWEIMRSSMGDFTMYQNLLLDPGWILDFNRVYTDFLKNHFRIWFEENGVPDGAWLFDDIAYRSGLFASPKVMYELFLPFYAEIVSFFNHEYGLPVLFHSDGRLHEAVPIILDAGFVGLHPLESKAGNDLFELADQYGDRLIFIGGFDVRIFETNDRDLIASKIKSLLQEIKTREVGYIFGSDHTITPQVKYDTYRFALDIFMQHRYF
ncbi:MAG: uroporphyrinogen decarboxylase family protein [Anaerolineales bacterium]